MADSLTIDKKDGYSGDIDFAALKQSGIEYVQQLSGKHWTDYNIHDPGVTVLEQLCYALTDLVYRVDFKVADHLTGKDGRIDYSGLALYPPEAILPARPTTLPDYQKVIFDGVRELDHVWLMPVEESACGGLYRIMLRLKEGITQEQQQAVIEKVRAVYCRNRNLGEDLAEITVVRDVDCQLHARIEISDSAAAPAILARIYYECAKLITAGIRLYPYEEILRSGLVLDEILTGPFCAHGYIKEQELIGGIQEVLITDLFSVINALDGVSRISSLYLEENGKIFDTNLRRPERGTAPRLRIPQTVDDIKVDLFKDGRTVSVSIKEFIAGYEELNFSEKTRLHRLEDVAILYTPPCGKYLEPGDYTTIQNAFPPAYGINAYGIPATAAVEVKAQARQLKGYLVLFDQLLANHKASLDSLRELFSPASRLKRSYAFQVLNKDHIADLQAIYNENTENELDKILQEYDDYTERKGRLLDYILALYGEALTQEALIHFNAYYTQRELKAELINNKAEFLRLLLEIGRDRGGAFDYREPVWRGGNIAGLQRKLSILLGFKYHYNRSLTRGIVKRGLSLIPDESFRKIQEKSLSKDVFSIFDAKHMKLHSVQLDDRKKYQVREKRRDIAEIWFLKRGVISESLFTKGSDIDAYKVVSLDTNQGCQLMFRASDTKQSVYLGTYSDSDLAMSAATHLRQLLIHLNIKSEGLYLLEHILLRPERKSSDDDVIADHGEDFYSFKISIIFPAWSRRCQDESFRSFAEETVLRECPAHIMPDIYWFDFNKFRDFEALYRTWLEHKSGNDEDLSGLRASTNQLIQFLMNHKQK